MSDPIEMPNIDAIVETIRVARRSEEGARMHVSLSMPVKDAPHLLSFLAGSLKNPVRVGFSEIQARLPEGTSVTITGPQQDIRYAEHKTTVDGAEAVVLLPVTEGGRRNKIAPHPYKDDPENKGKCLWCNHGVAYQAHDETRIEAAAQAELTKVKSNGYKATPDELAAQGEEMHQRFAEAYKTPHAFEPRTQDDCCNACGHFGSDAVHQPAVEVETIPEHLREGMPEAASKLIEDAAETEAVPHG